MLHAQAPEELDNDELVNRHWENAFSTYRTLVALREKCPEATLLIRLAEGEFLGAAAVLYMYWEGPGEFDLSIDDNAARYNKIIALIEKICDELPAMPDGVGLASPTWDKFLSLVAAIHSEHIGDSILISDQLANDHPSCTTGWWRRRALAYLKRGDITMLTRRI